MTRIILAAAILAGLAGPALAYDDNNLFNGDAGPDRLTGIPMVPSPARTYDDGADRRVHEAIERERTEREMSRLQRERDDLEFENRRLQRERDWDYPRKGY